MKEASSLLDRLRQRDVSPSTSAFGRFAKTAKIAAKAGMSALRSKRAGATGVFERLDEGAIEEMVLEIGELKGLAMKMGQILSYVDDSMPEETRRILASLQRWSNVTPWSDVEATIREDLEDGADALGC